MNNDRWYFAYGSNLLVDQKENRTGRIRKSIKCRLPGYRFVYNKKGSNENIYANIMSDTQNELWGVIYLCNPDAINEMDKYEGVSGGHYRHMEVEVLVEDGERIRAMTYVAGEGYVVEESRPKKEYHQKIVHGAKNHDLPERYIQYIESLYSTA